MLRLFQQISKHNPFYRTAGIALIAALTANTTIADAERLANDPQSGILVGIGDRRSPSDHEIIARRLLQGYERAGLFPKKVLKSAGDLLTTNHRVITMPGLHERVRVTRGRKRGLPREDVRIGGGLYVPNDALGHFFSASGFNLVRPAVNAIHLLYTILDPQRSQLHATLNVIGWQTATHQTRFHEEWTLTRQPPDKIVASARFWMMARQPAPGASGWKERLGPLEHSIVLAHTDGVPAEKLEDLIVHSDFPDLGTTTDVRQSKRGLAKFLMDTRRIMRTNDRSNRARMIAATEHAL